MTDQDAEAALKCRYRYATGCTAEYGSKPGLYAHEKQAPAHAAHRIDLRDCPECGQGCGDEANRARHLSAEHGIRAGSEQRSEMDACQVRDLHAAGGGLPPALAAASLNGHVPAPPDLSAARDALSALIGEVAALRAENAALKADAATFAQIRSMLAAQAS